MDLITVFGQRPPSEGTAGQERLLDENPDVVLFALLSSSLWVRIWFPIPQFTGYTLDHDLRSEWYDLR